MRTLVSRWGNSLAVRLPKACLEAAGLREGAQIEIVASAGELVLRPVLTDTEALVAALHAALARGVSPDPDPEWERAPPMGDELW